MALRAQALVTKPGDVSSVPTNHMVKEREPTSSYLFSSDMCVPQTHTHTHTKLIYANKINVFFNYKSKTMLTGNIGEPQKLSVSTRH